MRFDLVDLRLLLNVCDAGTITGGAAITHMTLASASERIRGMEEALGVPLLLRDRRGVKPTPAGRTVVHHARIVLRQVACMQGDLGDHGAGLRGHVRLLCNTSALNEHLPEVLSRFLRDHRRVSIDLEERSSFEIVDAVRSGTGDVGVVSDVADLEGLETYPFRADPLSVVVPADHALAQRRRVVLADLVAYDFVGLNEGSALQEHVSHHARRLGKQLHYRIRMGTIDSVCRMVGLGIGVGIVPRATAVRCARSSRIKRIDLADAWAARRLVACVRGLDALPRAVQELVRHIVHARGERHGDARRR